MGAAADDIPAVLHAVMDDGGQEGGRQILLVGLLDLLLHGHHALDMPVHHAPEGILQPGIGVIGVQTAVIRTGLFLRDQVDAVVESQFQGLAQIEHGGVAPAQLAARRAQLDAADDGLVQRIRRRHAQILA